MIEVKLNIDMQLNESQVFKLKEEFAYINSIRLGEQVSPEDITLIHDNSPDNVIASEILQPEPKN